MKRAVIILALTVLTGCVVQQTTMIPDGDSPSAKLYAKRCGKCHEVPSPDLHTYEQWKHVLRLMDKEMEKKNIALLSGKERDDITRYLLKHGK